MHRVTRHTTLLPPAQVSAPFPGGTHTGLWTAALPGEGVQNMPSQRRDGFQEVHKKMHFVKTQRVPGLQNQLLHQDELSS